MYGKPIPPVAGAAGLAFTGFYAGTAVLVAIVLLILGAVLLRVSYFRRQAKDVR